MTSMEGRNLGFVLLVFLWLGDGRAFGAFLKTKFSSLFLCLFKTLNVFPVTIPILLYTLDHILASDVHTSVQLISVAVYKLLYAVTSVTFLVIHLN